MIVFATYTSVWDDVRTISTPCKFNTETKRCFDIEDSGESPDGSLTDEYVSTAEDSELRESDGVIFEYKE